MTQEEQQIAMAQACGWTEVERCTCSDGVSRGYEPTPGAHKRHIPDYLNDLNAIHKAERLLMSNDGDRYMNKLYVITRDKADSVIGAEFAWCSATAAQRLEAMLKTLNLWKP